MCIRDSLWIKNGFFLLVDTPDQLRDEALPLAEREKLQGEIHFILYDEQISHLRKLNQWPAFELDPTGCSLESEDVYSSSADEMPDFLSGASLNPNHTVVMDDESDDEE
eukprot:TRINITY_DN19242_c0_g1_i4.p1 TRINITY_DN19242_c0_g1~~TRINITY_DN19242_c0_g1_i4.p1  ORF type:complete len:109 (+),score=39.71 TRINITY_DN19242_c0_g1_i4:196-522(+)